MIFHDAPSFRIYFGNAKDKLSPSEYLNLPENKNILELEPYKNIKKFLNLDSLIFLHQVHGSDGQIISVEQMQAMQPFKIDGDYLITADKHLGIGVMAADCLPIVFYDSQHNVAAIAHAGWRSSVQEIALKVLADMKDQFKTDTHAIKIFFGPSAKICCYEVKQDFLQHLDACEYTQEVIQQRNGAIFFNLPRFNQLQLMGAGIKKDAFRLDYNICTMCDDAFYSGRQGAGRQMTVISLK